MFLQVSILFLMHEILLLFSFTSSLEWCFWWAWLCKMSEQRGSQQESKEKSWQGNTKSRRIAEPGTQLVLLDFSGVFWQVQFPCVSHTVRFHTFPSVPVMEKWVDVRLPTVLRCTLWVRKSKAKNVPFLVNFWCCFGAAWLGAHEWFKDLFNDHTLIYWKAMSSYLLWTEGLLYLIYLL